MENEDLKETERQNRELKSGEFIMELIDNPLEEQIAVDEKRVKVLKEIERLDAPARKEKQPKKKFELVQEINRLKIK